MWPNKNSIVQSSSSKKPHQCQRLQPCVSVCSASTVSAEGVSGAKKGKQGLLIILLLASKSTQTRSVLTFNPLDLNELNAFRMCERRSFTLYLEQ